MEYARLGSVCALGFSTVCLFQILPYPSEDYDDESHPLLCYKRRSALT